jgi:biotin operon repressor
MTDPRLNLLTYLSTRFVPIRCVADDMKISQDDVIRLAQACSAFGVQIDMNRTFMRVSPLCWPLASRLADNYFERHIR